MKQDEIIEMARQAGICSWLKPPEDVKERFEIFAKLVAAKAIAELESQAQDWDALAEKQLASIKRDMKATTEDAVVRATHKVMADLESQEPVALPCCGYRDASAVKWNPLNDVVQCHNCGQTYAHPPQRTWQGLTDEDKKQMAKEANYHWEMTAGEYAERIGQLTEAKLKEKNSA